MGSATRFLRENSTRLRPLSRDINLSLFGSVTSLGRISKRILSGPDSRLLVILSETDVVQPDLFVVLHGGTARITDKNVQGPPDLVVEILPPGASARDRELKRKRYEHFKVREYWLVDPDANSIEVLTLQADRFVRLNLLTPPASCTSPLFPELTIDLSWLLK